MAAYVGIKLRIANFSDFAGAACAAPSAAILRLFEEPHLAKEVARVKVGNNDFFAVVVFEDNRDRAADNIVERIAGVAFVDERRAVWVATAVAVGEEVIQVANVRSDRL